MSIYNPTGSCPNEPIVVRPMRHQGYIKRQKEDWAGVTDQKKRKKLQNRLNQRARRQRQPPQRIEAKATDAAETATDGECTAETVGQTRARWERFAMEAVQNYMLKQPNMDQLMRVIKLNTINAMTLNASALKLPVDWLICTAMSPFGVIGPAPVAEGAGASPPGRPASLVPTDLQLRIPHHPWIDLFPLARMRNNWLHAIYVAESLTEDDEVQLWDDLVDWGRSGGTEEASGGLVVWGDPSDPRSWEATVPFLRRWGRLLLGCDEILEATNYWRRSRGERCIPFKL